jgi:hypothetical protein
MKKKDDDSKNNEIVEVKEQEIKIAVSDYYKEEITKELTYIASQNDGVLNPHQVVDFARNPETELHKKFEWDEGLAAEGFRVIQARGLLKRIKLIVWREQGEDRHIEVGIVHEYQSLPDDRTSEGGYRKTVDIFSDADQTKLLLKSAKQDFLALEKKYANLEQLSSVWAEVHKINI